MITIADYVKLWNVANELAEAVKSLEFDKPLSRGHVLFSILPKLAALDSALEKKL